MDKESKKEKKFKIKSCKKSLKPNKNVSGSFSFSTQSVKEYNEALGKVKNEAPPQPKKKSKLWTWLFLLFNIGVVVGIFVWQFSKGEVKSLYDLFAEHPYYRFLFLALIIQFSYLIIESIKISQLIHRSTKKFRPILAFKTATIGRYWDCITPFGSGGQPFQIMYLKKGGCSGDVATGVTLAKYVFWQIAYLFVGLIVLCIPFNIATGGRVVKLVALGGVIVNALLLIVVLLVSINKKFGSKLIIGVLKLLNKLKLIKNYNKALQKTVKFVEDYQSCMRAFAKSPFQIITQILYAVINILLNASIAFCIYLAFNYPVVEHSWIQIVCMSLLCEYAMSIIPIPGGSGFAEISFVAMFSLLFKAGTVFWALLFWRIFTYYFFIILGFIITVVDTFAKRNINKGLKGFASTKGFNSQYYQSATVEEQKVENLELNNQNDDESESQKTNSEKNTKKKTQAKNK